MPMDDWLVKVDVCYHLVTPELSIALTTQQLTPSPDIFSFSESFTVQTDVLQSK